MRFEPSIYLEAMLRDFLAFGEEVVVRTFDSPRDLMLLDEDLIVNCTGLGSKALFGDQELTPVKGQLVVLVPQPEVDYSMGGMLPLSDGIVLGHVQQPDNWSLEVDIEERNRVVENSMRTLSALRTPRLGPGPMQVAMSPPVVRVPPTRFPIYSKSLFVRDEYPADSTAFRVILKHPTLRTPR